MTKIIKRGTGRPRAARAATLFIVAISCLLLARQSFAAEVNVQDEVMRCSGIESDSPRLACFDELSYQIRHPREDAATEEAACQEIKLDDLKLDIRDLNGECFTVNGEIIILGQMATLGAGGFDTSPLFLDVQELPREQRKILLRCNPTCRLTITGIVGSVMMQPGLIVKSIKR